MIKVYRDSGKRTAYQIAAAARDWMRDNGYDAVSGQGTGPCSTDDVPDPHQAYVSAPEEAHIAYRNRHR